jgi:hypothetical protein
VPADNRHAGFFFPYFCTVNNGSNQEVNLDLLGILRYKNIMNTKKRPGRPKKSSQEKRDEYLDVRLDKSEKEAFKLAAEVSGLTLAAWVRSTLRTVAREQLIGIGRQVPFLHSS